VAGQDVRGGVVAHLFAYRLPTLCGQGFDVLFEPVGEQALVQPGGRAGASWGMGHRGPPWGDARRLCHPCPRGPVRWTSRAEERRPGADERSLVLRREKTGRRRPGMAVSGHGVPRRGGRGVVSTVRTRAGGGGRRYRGACTLP